MRARSWLITAVLLVGPGAVGVAHADPARDNSRIEFTRGVTLVHNGDYHGARDAFAEAYRLFPHPSILLNLGIAQWKIGQYVEAEASLVKFLADYGDASAENVESARAALREVRAHLGSVRLVVTTPNARVTFDARQIPVTPNVEVAIAGTVGDHELVVEGDGFAPEHDHVHLDAGTVKPLSVTLAPGTASASSTTTAPPAAGEADTGSSGDASSTRAIVGWSLLGVGAAAAIAGTICGVEAISKADDYNHHGFDPSDKSSGTTFRTLSDVTFATAIVTGGLGLYFVLSKPSSSATPGATPDPASPAAAATAIPTTALSTTALSLGLGPASVSLRQTF